MGLVKGAIRWALNRLPRTLLQRVAGWAVPVVGLLYLGKGRECPICGVRRRKFLPYGYVTQREDALCPRCLALERHRMLWLWIVRETRLLDECPELLHIAPEVSLQKPLRRIYKASGRSDRYRTADLESPLAEMHFDVQSIPLADGSVDVIICNHLLEHVEDERKALSELHRILRPGGWAALLSPVDLGRERTFEDDSITSPQERTRIFGQYDHRRIYGRDYPQRLAEAGFEVADIDFAAELAPRERRRYAIRTDEHLYIVRRSNNG